MAQRKNTPLGSGTAPGWRIPDKLRDEFTRWCDKYKRGYEDEYDGRNMVKAYRSALVK